MREGHVVKHRKVIKALSHAIDILSKWSTILCWLVQRPLKAEDALWSTFSDSLTSTSYSPSFNSLEPSLHYHHIFDHFLYCFFPPPSYLGFFIEYFNTLRTLCLDAWASLPRHPLVPMTTLKKRKNLPSNYSHLFRYQAACLSAGTTKMIHFSVIIFLQSNLQLFLSCPQCGLVHHPLCT